MAGHADTPVKLSPGSEDGTAGEHSANDAGTAVRVAEPEQRQRQRHRLPRQSTHHSPRTVLSWALVVMVVTVIALGAVSGYLGYQLIRQDRADDQRNLFIQVAKQGALNLTTIDWQTAEADVARILDAATGQFYDDFSQRSQPFIDVVKQAQSKSQGTITEAGVESEADDAAQVLVAVTVNTSNVGAEEQQPRRWKMRVTVQKTEPDVVKISNVVFVP